jgi:hypothetical protein
VQMSNGVTQMAEQDKLLSVIAKLNELTQEGDLKWYAVPNPESLDVGTDKKPTAVYETKYKDKRLRIYREEYKYWYDEDRWEWSSKIILAFVDKNNQNAWEFPDVAGLADLYDSVRYQGAGVDQFIKDMLSGEK